MGEVNDESMEPPWINNKIKKAIEKINIKIETEGMLEKEILESPWT